MSKLYDDLKNLSKKILQLDLKSYFCTPNQGDGM